MTKSEREVPAVVLETDVSKAGKHLSTAEVGLGNKPDFFTRVAMTPHSRGSR